MSSRASRAAKENVTSKFAELRALRAAGKKRGATYRDAEDEDVYDEVDEADYKDHVRRRLDQNDFVVDDDGLGYADTGADDWDTTGRDATDEDPGRRRGRGGRKADKVQPAAEEDRISRYLSKKPVAAQAAPSTTVEQDNDFLAGLLGDVSSERRRGSERRPAPKRALSPEVETRRRHKRTGSVIDATPLPAPAQATEDYSMDVDMLDITMPEPPSSPTPKVAAPQLPVKETIQEEDEDGDDWDVKAPTAYDGKPASKVNIAATRPVQQVRKPVPAPAPAPSSPAVHPPTSDRIDSSAWMELNSTLQVATTTSSIGKVDLSSIANEDGKVHFYWMDYAEMNGSLGLIGKVKDRKINKYVSAFCRVDGLMRNLYFLPREQSRSSGSDVSMGDVHAEVSQLMRQSRIEQFKAKSSSRKYAFELPGVPEECDYLKVLYSYKNAPLPLELAGDTFSRVFGTNTAMFEQFVLYRRVMGPCWLEVSGADAAAAQNSTWCKAEFGVADPDQITPVSDVQAAGLPETPAMTMVSVSMRTLLNQKDNKAEIVLLSARVYPDINIEDPTPADKLPAQTFTVMRPIRNVFPHGFEQEARKQNISLERSEAAMLNSFMARWQQFDPDIVLGHDWESQHYTTLLARLREKKVSNWHRIGRLKRLDWPKTMGRAGFFAERALACGRLMCDLSNDLGKSLIRAQSWTLTEICKLELGVVRQDMDSEKALQSWTETASGLVDFAMHAVADTFYQAAVAIRVQIIPLSRQLTTLAGNSWAATLSGTRAQRNEYILLHEFYKNKYICPDKVWTKAKDVVEDDEEEGTAGKKKDKFKGGLVFEPERGLYDRFILVMDFNSLYPSIIQEYNICFTTVDRHDKPDVGDEEVVPEPPSRETAQGILPRIIATLVNRRRQVKQLMKDDSATATQKAQWDIRQQALKLTANSMYGCLGYTRSRFYARPLAMLTTFKGREALTSTKELADELGLRVIYGDTDSVMINTGVDNYLEAVKIGNDFKRQVNERYRLLEIDVDNVFQRMLLHAKKKYAALVLAKGEGGKLVAKMEVKGLDMKRREYCALAKDASQYCLDEILSGEQTETVVERIHDYLRALADKVRKDAVPRHKYIILNRLGKEPESYPQAKTMPHVQVALKRKARGEIVRVGDVMQYIVTAGDAHVADRSYPASDVIRSDSKLDIDHDYYLSNQILPPIERLCAPIEGTDRTRIAECLGLDVSKYRIHSNAGGAGTGSGVQELETLEASTSDVERFADCRPLVLRCRACGQHSAYAGMVDSLEMVSTGGVCCGHCKAPIATLSLNAQLHAQVQACVARYYQAWLRCDDPGCGATTQSCGVYGRRCPMQADRGCRGEMHYAYNDKQLYAQLLYYDSLFDVARARNYKAPAKKDEAAAAAAPGNAVSEVVDQTERIKALAEMNAVRFDSSRQVVGGFLKRCGRRYVDMASVFAFCA